MPADSNEKKGQPPAEGEVPAEEGAEVEEEDSNMEEGEDEMAEGSASEGGEEELTALSAEERARRERESTRLPHAPPTPTYDRGFWHNWAAFLRGRSKL